MNRKILCVDDEPNILDACRRALRHRFEITTATSGADALEIIAAEDPFSVLVSDMRMPEMDGVQFLVKAREASPNSVRIMLTGNGDQQTAMDAVNEGHIFRFLTKPCPPETLAKALEAGIDQYRLIMAEKELLEQTLSGSIKALTELLSLVNPEAFGRSSRISQLVAVLSGQLGLGDDWRIMNAARLSQLGGIILPESILAKIADGWPLDPSERQLFEQHPFVASDLLGKIPRMKEVAEIIAYQEKRWDGSGIPRDSRRGEDIPLGARILKAVLDLDVLESAGCSRREAFEHLKERPGWYDPVVLTALQHMAARDTKSESLFVEVDALEPGMIVAEDIRGETGTILIAKGQSVTPSMIAHLKNFARAGRISGLINAIPPQERVENAVGA